MKLTLTIAAFAALFPGGAVAPPPQKDPTNGTGTGDETPGLNVDGVGVSICKEDAIYSYKCGTEIFVCGIVDNDAGVHDDFYNNHLCGTSKSTGTITYFTTDYADRSYDEYCDATRLAMMAAGDDQKKQQAVRCPNGKEMR
jgi:hypothetical protein